MYEGKVTFRNGEIFIRPHDAAEISGVSIEAKSKDVKLFFDGAEHTDCKCTYVSIDKNEKVLVSGSNEKSEHVIRFIGQNPFVKLQSPLSIYQNFGTIIVQNREKNGLISSIMMKFEPILIKDQKDIDLVGVNTMFNGNKIINVHNAASDENVLDSMVDNPQPLKSNPLVLRIEDMQGKSLLGTQQEPKRLVFDENNRVSTLSYKEVSSLEPIRLYFSLPEDVKVTAEKALEAAKRRDDIVREINQKWNTPPMWMVGWLDDSREARIIRALKSASAKSDLPPDLVTAVAFNEGLNVFIEGSFYVDPNSEVSGFGSLGLDNFGSEAEGLKKMGYLRKDFSEYKIPDYEIKNEQGQKVISANFPNIDVAIEAMAARLKWTRDMVLKDARKYGYKLDKDQLDYWTYIYYNCGPNCKTGTLKNRLPEIPATPGSIGVGDALGIAKRVLGTRDIIKKIGLFDKSISEQIVKK